ATASGGTSRTSSTTNARRALRSSPRTDKGATGERVNGKPQGGTTAPAPVDQPLSPQARGLEERIREWLRREAVLGGAVLLGVALLGVFAGSLAPTPTGVSGNSVSGTSVPYISQPQRAGSYTVTLHVSPARFGSNAFVVTVADDKQQPVTGAVVVMEETSLD